MQEVRNFVEGEIYHLYNRGVAKQKIFRIPHDYERLLERLAYYIDLSGKPSISRLNRKELGKILKEKPKNPLVSIINFCLMPNHFHFLIKQLAPGGISLFMKNALNSYARYFNTRHDRVGPIFQGRFKAVRVETSEQLMYLSRYIHLNSFMAKLVKNPAECDWSSYNLCFEKSKTRLCNPKIILEQFRTKNDYRSFVEDYAQYAIALEEISDLILE